MKKIALLITVCILCCAMSPALPVSGGSPAGGASLSYLSVGNSYSEYAKRYENEPRPDADILLPASEAVCSEDADVTLEGGVLLWGNSEGSLRWKFSVEESGVYYLKLKYCGVGDGFIDIQRIFKIDGSTPFAEMSETVFSKACKNKDDIIKTDNQGNQLRPTQVAAKLWQEVYIRDYEGMFPEPFGIYLAAGEHEIEMVGVNGPVKIEHLRICGYEGAMSYEEYGASVAGKPDGASEEIRIQGESAALKSSPSLYPVYSRDNCYNEPFSIRTTTFNSIGGYNWRANGQWIEWDFDVPESGYYKMGVRFKQDFLMGIPITRRIDIDGTPLFDALEDFRFDYKTEWQLKKLQTEEGKDCLIYLTEGRHTLRMTAYLNDIAVALYNIRQITKELLAIYSKIIMVTGTSPDIYRDYQLTKRIGGLTEDLQRCADNLRDMASYIRILSNDKASEAHSIERIYEQIETMVAYPEKIGEKLAYFKDNLNSLSSWILTMSETPVTIDYITFLPKGTAFSKENPGFWEQAAATMEAFLVSFLKDYTKVGNAYDATEAIDVWVLLGREQAETLKSIIDDSFTSASGVNVNMNIIANESVLLFSVAAGRPPDVALGLSQTLPVDYGLRGAVLDLSPMEGFKEVAARFSESAVTPFEYEGKVYALPQTQSFPMMFYRSDILDQLGIPVPKTWEQMYEAIQTLQERNLTAGLTGVLDTLIFQNGSEYYNARKTKCMINSAEGLRAFKTYTSFYTDYALPLEYDFYSRFRSGEMPIVIADYTAYNTFAVSAPEIKSLWRMAPVPATADENGNLNGSVAGVASSIVMFSTTENEKASWKFIKWWTDTDVQIRYGTEIEAVLSAGARYNSANREAMLGLPWDVDDLQVINTQWESVKGIPMIPGSYYTTRHLDNAFREVYSLGEVPRNALSKYVTEINKEIAKKRLEFNLPAE